MKIQHDTLHGYTEAIFAAAGCETAEAACVARHLVGANLAGHDSHGVIRIPRYVQWLQEGKVVANQPPEVVLDGENMAVLDGQWGLGQSVGETAVQMGIDKSAGGVSVVALRNVGHLGRIGDWPLMAAEAGRLSVGTAAAAVAVLRREGFVVLGGQPLHRAGDLRRREEQRPFHLGVPGAGGRRGIRSDRDRNAAEDN